MPIDIDIEENTEIFESLKSKLIEKHRAISEYIANTIISSVLRYVDNNGFIHTGALDEENGDKKNILILLKELVKINEEVLTIEPEVYYDEKYKPIEEIFKKRGSPDELEPYIHRSKNCLVLKGFISTDLEECQSITEDIAQRFPQEIQMIRCTEIPEERKKIFLAALKYATIMVIEKQNELVKGLITKIEKKMAAQYDSELAVGAMAAGFKSFRETSGNAEEKGVDGTPVPSEPSAKPDDGSRPGKLSL